MGFKLINTVRENFLIRVFTIFTLLIFAISISFTFFFIQRQSSFLKESLIKNGYLLAKVLAYNSRIGVFSENKDLLNVPIEGIVQQEWVLEVSIFNFDGKLLNGKTRHGIKTLSKITEKDADIPREYFEKSENDSTQYYREDAQKVEFWAPVISGSTFSMEESLFLKDETLLRKNQIIGYARVTIDKKMMNQELNNILFTGLLIGMIFLIISSGVAFIVVRGVTRPLNRLTKSVKALGTGEIAEKVPVETKDEIGKLAKAFNKMSESLSRRERALRESEESYRELADSITDVFFAIDKNFKCIYWNKASEKFRGIAAKEAIGKTIYEIFEDTPENRKAEKTYMDVLQDQMPQSFVNECLWSEKPSIFEVTVYPSGSGLSIYAKDITDRRHAEEELVRSKEQLRNLADHLQTIREEERTGIARELHDELGQALTGLKMDISWLIKKMPSDQHVLIEKLNETVEVVTQTGKTVQKICSDLRPGLLDDLGLIPAIMWQAEEFERRTGINSKLNIDLEDIAVDDKLATTLFRIYQETLTNIVRHAQATKITVYLKEKKGVLNLTVADNGRGITRENISDSKSFGLIGMRERLIPWGGEVRIKGIANRGTIVSIRIPLGNIRRIS